MLGLLLLWLLVGPRIELPRLGGLRVEDGVFAAMAALCLLHVRRLGRPTGPTVAVVCVVVAGLISATVASASGMVEPVTAVLFAVRPIEYWITFPAVLLLLRCADGRWRRRLDTMLVFVTVLQTLFAVLQYYFGLQIGFSHASYSRAAGLTVGPYELGAISAALVVYWVAKGRFAMASLATVALAASISRASILGAAAALVVLGGFWVARLRRRDARMGRPETSAMQHRSHWAVAGQVVSVAGAVLVLAFTLGLIHVPTAAPAPSHTPKGAAVSTPPADEAGSSSAPGATESTAPSSDGAPGPVAESPAESPASAPAKPRASAPPGPSDSIAQRLATTSVLGSWTLSARLAAAAPRVDTSAQYQDIAYSRLSEFVNLNTAASAGAEPSNLVRFFRWHVILNTIDTPSDVIFGLGPSFVGPSVDGSYLRMFADGGLLGLAAWAALIVLWLRRTPPWMVAVTISLLVGAVFIDIVYSQRPMVLYWMLLAVAVTRPPSADAATLDAGAYAASDQRPAR